MNVAPQLSKEDFSKIHNGKCYLHGAIERLEGVIHEKTLQELRRAYDLLNEGLQDAYRQDDAAFKVAVDAAEKVAEEHKLKSVWSMYEVTDFKAVPFPQCRVMIYRNHWGKPVDVLLPAQSTWTDLWIAADDLIRRSGDSHHIFIESIAPTEENSFTLELSTGS